MSQSAPSQEQQFGGFNLYDIFANFLPGAVLLLGLFFPQLPKDLSAVKIGVASATTLAIVAFVVGFAIQAIASPLARQLGQPFDSIVTTIDCSQGDIEADFVSICEKKFGIDASNQSKGDDELSTLFKSILSDLENSPWSRTLRIQALHLAARGLAVAFLILLFYYLVYWCGLLTPDTGELFALPFAAPLATIGTSILFIVVALRARHFEKDVVAYMISEFTMNNSGELDS